MDLSLSERLTLQFYEWEKRGRGWLLFNAPIELEPEFEPFISHTLPAAPFVDDGRKRSLIHSLTDFISGKKKNPSSEENDISNSSNLQALKFQCTEPLISISFSLPKKTRVNLRDLEQLLLMLSNCRYPLSFEIIGSHTTIQLQFTCRSSDCFAVTAQLKAYFPESIIREADDPIVKIAGSGLYVALMDYGLQDEYMRPITMVQSLDLDPLIGLYALLEHLSPDEYAVIQLMFTATRNPWAESVMRSVTDNEGGAFFEDSPDMVPLAREKVSFPLFAVTLRVLGGSPIPERAESLLQSVGSALVRIYTSKANTLIALPDDGFDFTLRLRDIALRESHRLGMFLNTRELATLVHYPSPSVMSLKLHKDTRKTKAAPKSTEENDFIIGINEHQGRVKEVTISDAQRLKHTHIIGATGTGKSTLLLNLVNEDMALGNGFAVLDPHGDLIESIISYIPIERDDDVVIIDPSDAEFPIGFNILEAHSEIEKEILSSDLVASFRRLSTSWGDQMNSVFANAILAFLESKEGGTLADVRRFLVEKQFRDHFLKTVTDPNIVYYWQKEYPLLRTNSVGPILTRLDTFLRPKLIRNMVCQNKALNFEELLDSNKIILVKLSQGLIGTENSYLLGTLIVSKIHQAAMARQVKAQEDRKDFFLYIDEFQNFVTPSMSSILSGARKYHLGLILAHQDMQQITKVDGELASSVLSNAGTRICFRIGDADAKKFADGFSFFQAEDLQNLNTGEAIVRIDRPEFDFSLNIEPLSEPESIPESRDYIISHVRNKYGTPREMVESDLRDKYEDVLIPEKIPIPKKEEIKEKKKEPPAIEPIPEIKKQEPVTISDEDANNTIEQLKKQKQQTQHRYLQSYIKRMAESSGYKATVELPIPDSKGRVDVMLERNGKKIACEIAVNTEIEWEIHNIQKCLDAGYDLVVSCTEEKKTQEAIQIQVNTSILEHLRSKVKVLDSESFIKFLNEETAKEASTETRMKGFRVKVDYPTVSESEMLRKKEFLAKIITDAKKKK